MHQQPRRRAKAPPGHVANAELLAFNRMLRAVAADAGLELGTLPVASLYAGRGDAKIGMFGANGAIDCQHFCVSSALDGLARALLARLFGRSTG